MTKEENEQPPRDKKPAIQVLATPADTNPNGDIFGGWLMAQVDIAAYIEARRIAKGRVATVAVDAFQFHKPVFVGDLISCYCDIVKVGRTSVTVKVSAWAERRDNHEEIVKVTEATVVYVAIDNDRRPRPIPPA